MSRKKNRKKKNKSIISNQKNNQQLNKKVDSKTDDINLGTESSYVVSKGNKTELDEVSKAPKNSQFIENKKPSSKNIFLRITDLIIEKQVLSKIFIILFATFVFSFAYKNIEEMNRKALSYIGLILCIVVSYVEILGIRDHLWIIEGSLPSSKRWREAFFNPTSMRKYKLRRVIAILFAYIVFCYIYKLKAFAPARDTLSFLGIILMVTIVYYEVLAVRDQVNLISNSIHYLVDEKKQGIKTNEDDEDK
ncbi:MAG: hypothetical protein IKO19_02335 [Candidatus Riflebacteria bacterium]|nr:hypothetical protein [Candidatus Riflebacteria bacterium]MBR4569496.1 hypothetical protein [Candidatus Riflebacteria bacterium]